MAANIPRNAVILAAGFGSRLRPLTDLRPKPLVEVNGVPILHNALRNLDTIGVRNVTIVVGYRKDAIEYACGNHFGNLGISYVESTVFDKTGSAYSLWLARNALLEGDCYLLEGDVFFELDALRVLTRSETGNAAAVAPFSASMEGSAVILSADGYVAEVRMKQTLANLTNDSPPLFKTMNLIRFSAEDLRSTIVRDLDDLIGSGAVKSYTEELLCRLVQQKGLRVAAARCDDVKWYEIDTAEDLQRAREIFARSSEIPRAAVAAE